MRRTLFAAIELVTLTALVVVTRCANYQDVFVSGKVYFTDADCYARMTRVRLCAARPGLIVRHHDFENYPAGTTPHTTAPLDYLILGLAAVIGTARPAVAPDRIDLAGALISPLLAIVGAWFLWWWARRMQLRFRWILLLLYVLSLPLVHATELGRPDHQSLVLVLVLVAVCSEWALVRLDGLKPSSLTTAPDVDGERLRSGRWAVLAATAWATAIWVSAYEPLILFLLTLAAGLVRDRRLFVRPERRTAWLVFAIIIAVALLIERRLPSFPLLERSPLLLQWSRSIGELQSVPLVSRVWFGYAGYLLLFVPVLWWWNSRNDRRLTGGVQPDFITLLLVATFALTIWQVRWAPFFVLVFALSLPVLLETIRSPAAVWTAFALSTLPLMQEWDARLWPNESELALRLERRREMIDLRQVAAAMLSSVRGPFMAPWWFSPAIAYWSGQPAVAGSSHEALAGTAESARFYLSENAQLAREMLQEHGVDWVIAYDSDRTAAVSAGILGTQIPVHPLCQVLDRTPGRAPEFLRLVEQNGTAKLYRSGNNR